MTNYNQNEKIFKLEEAKSYIEKLEMQKGKEKISIEDAILFLLTVLDWNKKIISRTLLMKSVFLFYEEVLKFYGLSNGAAEAGYVAYKYGPYSYKVNLALIMLVLKGNIMLEEYHTKEKGDITDVKSPKKHFLASYSTNLNFDDVARKYKGLFTKKDIDIKSFKELLAEKKHGWDQDTYIGILRYVYSKYNSYISKSELREVFPDLFYGIIKEDRVSPYDRSKRSI